MYACKLPPTHSLDIEAKAVCASFGIAIAFAPGRDGGGASGELAPSGPEAKV